MPTNPSVMRRVMRELSELQSSPSEGIRVQTNDQDMLDVTGIIEGPQGTPYAGGYFRVKFKFTEEFPAAPPKCWFVTKIFHPNVGSTGEICVNTLKKDWKSTYGIGHILVTVKCLLIYPNPESALDEEAGKLLLENYDSYCSRAKLITSVHATPKKRPAEFDTPVAEAVALETDAVASTGTETVASEPSPGSKAVASTSKISSSILPPPITSLTSPPTRTTLSLPTITRKSTSPAPPLPPSLKSTLSVESKDGNKEKDRHPSPSPLGTADANVGSTGKVSGVSLGLGTPSTSTTSGPKTMKRAATSGMTSGAEKRKKALKRL